MLMRQNNTDTQGAVVLINTYDFPGGAAVLTRRLMQALPARRRQPA